MPDKSRELTNILLIEDDSDDIAITERALRKAKLSNPLYIVRDGQEAMEFLTHTGKYTDKKNAPRPGLILLDLNMPRLDGREVLERIKDDPNLKRIPVVVLTTSSQEEDIIRSYNGGANTFITKPVDFKRFIEAVVAIGKYWLEIAKIPENGGADQ